MNLVFVSNILNHHQIALCKAFQKKMESFIFIATDDTAGIGYQRSQEENYVLHYYNKHEREKCLDYILNADIVIFGSCPDELIQVRMKDNKLSFLYTERFFKKGVWRRFIPRTRKKIMNRIGCYKDKNMYVLCASAYVAYDLSLIGYPLEKCFKWGYFPETKKYEDISKILDTKISSSILWVGRFLNWKHPEIPILIAKELKKDGYNFHLNIIGSGELENKLQQMIKKYYLQDCVFLKGAMNPKKVRTYMENSEILLFTSDQYEGWGAVLNEAMNSACGVIASNAVGSAPFLIDNGKSGLIYTNGKFDDLLDKVKFLLDHPNDCHLYGNQAYQAITNQWNAEIAAERFYFLGLELLRNKTQVNNIYKNGPCSLAK